MKKILIYLAVLLLLNLKLEAQTEYEFNLGIGTTAVDIETLVEEDENRGSWATDWGLTSYLIGLKYLKPINNKTRVGAEIDYHHLFWYSVSVPYGSSSTGGQNRIYRDYSVSGLKIMPFIRFGQDAIRYDVGFELNVLNGIVPGLYTSVMYNVELNNHMKIPLGVRMDLMFGTVVYPFIGVTGGLNIAK